MRWLANLSHGDIFIDWEEYQHQVNTYDDTSSDSLSKEFDVKLFSKKRIMKANHFRDAFIEWI